jgi:16S rRNA (cytosine967-C5)-methyltransferase
LLASAIEIAKPGGLVVYATCSLLQAENDDVVDAVLAARSDVREEQRRHLRPDVDGCDGFFVSSLRRVR